MFLQWRTASRPAGARRGDREGRRSRKAPKTVWLRPVARYI